MSIPIWVDTELEKLLFKKLKEEFTEHQVSTLISDYHDVRIKLKANIYEEIKRFQPGLTDHSSEHIKDVMDRAYCLIGSNNTVLTPIDYYVLCLCILFHDVGNIFGRIGHQKKEIIQKIYEHVRNTTNNRQFKKEKTIISTIASTHGGTSEKNIRNPDDTISDLTDFSYDGLYDKKINVTEIAALLRFSDELAEGVQRTSSFIILEDLLKKQLSKTEITNYRKIYNLIKNNIDDTQESVLESIDKMILDTMKSTSEATKHHMNSYVCDYRIDDKANRISITYHIPLQIKGKPLTEAEFEDMIEFTFVRLLKINKERLYCRHYSKILSQYNRISVKYYFTIDDSEDDLGMPILEISDLDLKCKSIQEIDESYTSKEFYKKINDKSKPNE
jgi:hypothetical protein